MVAIFGIFWDLCLVHVGTLPKGYVRNVLLPRVPKVQRARSHPDTTIPDYYKDTYIVPMQRYSS